MFYESIPSHALRFGDVVNGYISSTPRLKAPLSSEMAEPFTLEIQRPRLLSILSPCCSIRDKVLLLAPLIEVRGNIFGNPYFEEDLTRINRPMSPQRSVSPHVWGKLSAEEQARRMAQGDSYALIDLFGYAPNDLFPRYTVHRRDGNVETNAYVVDFRHAFRINCDRVIDPKNSPLDSKLLELSIQARSELREKISHFFRRVPDEDRVPEP